MMKKKSFLAGIISLGLVFALILTGCPTDGDDGGDGGGSGNPLLGTWANDLDLTNLGSVLIFTDSPVTGPGIAENTKLAYYAQGLDGGNVDYITEGVTYRIPITGAANSPYTADISELGSNKFSLTGYIAATNENQTGKVDFKRAQGTSGSQLRGVWISDLPTVNPAFTIILIGGANGRKVWSARGGNVATPNYRTTEDADVTYISWNAGSPRPYTKQTIGNNESLSIPPPIGGVNAADITLRPLYEEARF
jgi:hypothetical protein